MANMPHPPGDISPTIKETIEAALPGTVAKVEGGGGHYAIEVEGEQFRGLSRIEQQRLVYSAIAKLMAGDSAPLHAVDKLVTRAP